MTLGLSRCFNQKGQRYFASEFDGVPVNGLRVARTERSWTVPGWRYAIFSYSEARFMPHPETTTGTKTKKAHWSIPKRQYGVTLLAVSNYVVVLVVVSR
jgi:hypothetical protein